MSYTVLVEAAAKADLTAAFEWYETQAAGLGYEFLLFAEAAVAKLER